MYPFLYKHAKAKRITRFLQHYLRQQSALYIVNKSLIVAPQFKRLHFYASFDGTTSSYKALTTTLSASPAFTVISFEPEPSPTARG